jgi:hypothetical protein
MIWSVVMGVDAFPRMARSNRKPREELALAFLRITASLLTENETSVFGSKPILCRISIGIVTWPLLVIRTAPLLSNSYQ